MPGESTPPSWARRTLRVGAVFGGTGVILGAFGAHALTSILVPERLETFETAVRYQLIHALALLAVGLAAPHGRSGTLRWAARLMTTGILIFSGSLYLLVATDVGILGAVTPLGGVALIAGWIAFFTGVAMEPNASHSGPEV